MRITRRSLLAAAGIGSLRGAAPPIGLGFRLYGMKSLSAHEALQTLAAIGYDGAELEMRPGWGTEPRSLGEAERRALRDRFRELGLKLPAVNENLQLAAGGSAAHRDNIERLHGAAGLFHTIAGGGPALVETGLGGRSAGWESERDRMAERLGDWARAAEQSGMVIAFKPHAGHAVDTIERALWLLGKVGSPRIRIALDYSHFQIAGIPLSAVLDQLLPYTALVLAKDGAGSAADFTRLLPGEGGVDYVSYLKRLADAAYQGDVVVEVSQQIHSRAGYDPVDTARRCYANLAPAFDQAGVRRPARQSAERKGIGFGFRLYGMQGMETADALRTVARIGYDGVELELRPGWKTEPKLLSPKARKDLRRLLDDLGLAVPALNESLILDAPDEQHRSNLDRLERAAELFDDLFPGKPAVLETTMGGRTEQWDQRRSYMAARLADWAEAAGKRRMTVAVKAHVNSAVDRPERALWLLGQARSPWIRLVYDYSHFQLIGLTLEESLDALLPHTALVAVKDASGNEEKHEFHLPGETGVIDYAAYFRRLYKGGFRGFVNVEVSALVHRRPGYDPEAAAGRSYRNLAPAFEAAGVRRTRSG